MSPTRPSTVQAALVSVGGSPSPVLQVLQHYRPAHVWYFCSAGSRVKAEAIQAQLDWHPQARFIEVERFEELGPCYRVLRRKIPEILAETKVDPADVVVDYTGGTKTMSAAVVLAASEWFCQFSYVGGAQREKHGLGIVIDGNERMHFQGNPWSELAIREVERACDLWSGCQFDAAAATLREAVSKVPHRLRFEAIADLADAMAARHRLDFNQARKLLDPLQSKLPPLMDGRDDFGLLPFAREAQQICLACASDTANDTFLRELLDNALRTAAQGRFEDAAARLYRAMEMQGQVWLAEATDNLFIHGKCKPRHGTSIPVELKGLACCQLDPDGEIKLSLEECFRALAALGHERARQVVEDLETVSPAGQTRSRWRAATEKRNTSILAHGVQPIGPRGFEQMKTTAEGFLGFDLSREATPIPALDPRWLE